MTNRNFEYLYPETTYINEKGCSNIRELPNHLSRLTTQQQHREWINRPMKGSHRETSYLNQLGIAKVVHDPLTGDGHHELERYGIFILPHMAWHPIRVMIDFKTLEDAQNYFDTHFDQVEQVSTKHFDALCRNLAILPRP